MDKVLDLKCRVKEYVNEKGEQKKYYNFYVVVNGVEIPLQCKSGDATAYTLIKMYFES